MSQSSPRTGGAGFTVRLAKASGYFYFQGGEADDWLDKTVSVRNVSSLSLPQWMAEFERLRKLNGEIMDGKDSKPPSPNKPPKKAKGPI